MPKKTDITRRRGERGDSEAVKKYLAEIGRRGGAAGKGAAKRRGNSEYYRGIRRKRSRGDAEGAEPLDTPKRLLGDRRGNPPEPKRPWRVNKKPRDRPDSGV